MLPPLPRDDRSLPAAHRANLPAVGTNSGLYKILLLLHIVGIVGGIGPVVLNGLYLARAKRAGGAAGTAVSVATYEVSDVAEKVIYTIPVTGILLVLVSDGAISFGDTWIWLSIVLFVAAVGLSHAALIPGHRRYNALAAAEGGPSVGQEAKALEQRVAGAGMALNLLVVVLIALMIWKPGA
jgi:uncharacterized membrane protein